MGRDVQQVQEAINSPLRANGIVSRSQVKVVWLRETTNRLQAANYLPQGEGLIANRMGIYKFLQKHRETNNIERRPGSVRPTKMAAAVKALIDRQMRDNDETTAVQLYALLLPNRLFSAESF